MQKGALMEQLTNIISQISQIEERGMSIMQSANDEKNILLQEHEQRIQAFDRWLTAETEDKISKIRTDLNCQIQNDLDQQRAKTNELLEAMQKEYDEKHSCLAELIVKSIIGA